MSAQPRTVRPRTPGARPTRHLKTFAIGLPVVAAAGAAASLIDVVGTVTAALLPVAVFAGVIVTRLLVSRLFRWVWALVAAVIGGRTR